MGIEATQHYVNKALKMLDVSHSLAEGLIRPTRVIKTDILIQKDNGKLANFTGYRVQHNRSLGPMKGGLRYHPSIDEDDVHSLASLMTWKTALLRLPYGGAKGGVACDPGSLSSSEIERITRTFTNKIKEVIGPYQDIMAPDVNTNAQVMAWIMAEYEKYHGFSPAVVTGKPAFLYGSEGREEATGRGVGIIIDNLLSIENKSLKQIKIVIQGFGNVGFHTAKILHEKGAKIIAVSDVTGGLYNKEGLNIPEVKSYYDDYHKLTDFPGSQSISNEELLALSCDILIPAALGDVFNKENATKVRCQYIVEAANGPTLPEADEIFNRKNILVVPDILANAGGVTVSYFEWVQNIQQFHWPLEKVNEELFSYMKTAFERVIEAARSKHCSLREAAFLLGIGRVIRAMVTLGL